MQYEDTSYHGNEESPLLQDDPQFLALEANENTDLSQLPIMVTSTTTTTTTTTNSANYTDENGLLLYLDPNSDSPVILYRMSEERHARDRCFSNFYFVIMYLLLRVWIGAIGDKNMESMIICAAISTWLGVAILKKSRDWERELNRRTEEFMSLIGISDVIIGGEGREEFPASSPESRGISENTKRKWTRFKWKAKRSNHSNYQSININNTEQQIIPQNPNNEDEQEKESITTSSIADDVCSICLCEYEEGNKCVRLQCSHIYHEECISTWTTNHVRCPLCNLNLEI